MSWDIFISHASEDKASVARPLAELLKNNGLRIWLDENELTIGDSLRAKIDNGLAQSDFGIVIISPAFLSKDWPQRELNGLSARETSDRKVIIPVWHNLTHRDVAKFSPVLADKLAAHTSEGLDMVAEAILKAVRATRKTLVAVQPFYEALDTFADAYLEQLMEKHKTLSGAAKEAGMATYTLQRRLWRIRERKRPSS